MATVSNYYKFKEQLSVLLRDNANVVSENYFGNLIELELEADFYEAEIELKGNTITATFSGPSGSVNLTVTENNYDYLLKMITPLINGINA